MYSMNLTAWAWTLESGISAIDQPPAQVALLSPALGTGMYVNP